MGQPQGRPPRIEPGPGQESVWDYPRPPRVEDSPKHIQVILNGTVIADTRRAKRVLETSHPPVYYIPPEDVRKEYLQPSERATFCEWKGTASYYSLEVDGKINADAAWYYPTTKDAAKNIEGRVAFWKGVEVS